MDAYGAGRVNGPREEVVSVNEFRRAAEAKDLDAAVECMAEDIVLHSPVLFRPFEGKTAVRAVLSAALNTFEDFAYTGELSGDGTVGLLFRARVGDRELEGIDLLRLDAEGKIADFTVMIRPQSALNAFSAGMAADAGLMDAKERRGA